jgi:hypothetical protein
MLLLLTVSRHHHLHPDSTAMRNIVVSVQQVHVEGRT